MYTGEKWYLGGSVVYSLISTFMAPTVCFKIVSAKVHSSTTFTTTPNCLRSVLFWPQYSTKWYHRAQHHKLLPHPPLSSTRARTNPQKQACLHNHSSTHQTGDNVTATLNVSKPTSMAPQKALHYYPAGNHLPISLIHLEYIPKIISLDVSNDHIDSSPGLAIN